MTATTTDLPAGDTMTAEFYEEYGPEAARVASRQWKNSPVFGADDLEQAIWEHVMLNWKHYAKATSDQVTIYMTRAARSYAANQRVEYMYFTGAFIYTPKIVAAYLDTCAWQPLEEVPDVDARVDLREAFELLRASSPKQAAAVFKRYGLNDELTALDRKNCSLGVEALTHRLNTGLRLSAESIEFTSKEN